MTTSSTSSTTPTGERWDISPTCTSATPARAPTLRACCVAAAPIRWNDAPWRAGRTVSLVIRDVVAQELSRLHAAGFDGLALNFVDYLAELPYFAEAVLPRLERLGLRATHTH